MMNADAVTVPLPWPQVCEELWQAFADRLLLLARAIDPETAEDALQNLFARLLGSQGGVDMRHPGPYLFRAVRNESLNLKRSRRRMIQRHRSAAWFEAHTDDPAARAEEEEFRRHVQAALAELPEDLREAVVLKLWSGLTMAEAADIASITPKAFEHRYYDGFERLRERLGGNA